MLLNGAGADDPILVPIELRVTVSQQLKALQSGLGGRALL